jgi:hypothetical protein
LQNSAETLGFVHILRSETPYTGDLLVALCKQVTRQE